MAITAAELNVILSARDAQFQKKLKSAERRAERFQKNTNKSLSKVSKGFDALGAAAKAFLPALAAGLTIDAFKGAIDGAAELQNLSDIAGVTTDRFQVLALTSRQFGIEQDKLSDILKDVNDKFGDYTQTGAGSLADFFEQIAPKVGLTASAFADLSSEEKLGAYINALEKANVSQADMTFYMEAIASDSTALVAAFKNNGAAISEMEKKARDLGLVIDQETIAKSKEAKKELALMADVVSVQLNEALLAMAPIAVDAASAIATIASEVAGFLNFGNALSNIANMRRTPEQVRALAEEYGGLERELSAANEAQANYAANVDKYGEGSEQAAAWAKKRATAEKALADALAEKQAKKAADESAAAGVRNLVSETEELRKQAELQKLSAQEAERRRISTQRAAYEQQILNDVQKAGVELTDEELQKITDLGAAWEQAALGASKIINPIKRAGGAAKETKETVEQMLAKMIEASPALQQLGFDADKLKSVADTVQSSMESAFMSLVDGTMSAKDAFKAMAADIIRELYRVLVVQQLVGQFKTGGGGILGALAGGLTGLASGGSVSAGQPYMVGEHGRELFVPQTAGKVLSVPQTKTALQSQGGVTVIQNNTFGQGVSRAEINAMLPRIVETTKAAVFDAQRRSVTGRGYA